MFTNFLKPKEKGSPDGGLLYRVDLCVVVDTTGSMGGFIAEAKKRLIQTIESLSKQSNIDLHVGLVEYRDHPPQDKTFVTQVTNLTSNIKNIQSAIDKLKADGGGDAPEAVYQGLANACNQLNWREHSLRYIILVGDAPPHAFATWFSQYGPPPEFQDEKETVAAPRGRRRVGVDPFRGYVDAWQTNCPSGHNIQSITALCEKKGIVIHALCVGAAIGAQESFSALAMATGGSFRMLAHVNEAIQAISAVLSAEFANVVFDADVLRVSQELHSDDSAVISEKLQCPRLKVASSLARLGRRGFLT